jgi:hypothetical protein
VDGDIRWRFDSELDDARTNLDRTDGHDRFADRDHDPLLPLAAENEHFQTPFRVARVRSGGRRRLLARFDAAAKWLVTWKSIAAGLAIGAGVTGGARQASNPRWDRAVSPTVLE